MENVLVSEMPDNSLQLFDDEGLITEVPIIGMFKVDGNYYVVVLMEAKDQEQNREMVIFRVEKEDDKEYIQIITDRAEWDRAVEAWQSISAKVASNDVVPVEGQS